MSNYLLLDVNGTVGTDERPLLEYLETLKISSGLIKS